MLQLTEFTWAKLCVTNFLTMRTVAGEAQRMGHEVWSRQKPAASNREFPWRWVQGPIQRILGMIFKLKTLLGDLMIGRIPSLEFLDTQGWRVSFQNRTQPLIYSTPHAAASNTDHW